MSQPEFPIYPMNTEAAPALSVFTHSHHFFTVSPLFCYGRLQPRVLKDFLEQCPVPAHFVSTKVFTPRVLGGLPEPEGGRLWAIENPAWEFLLQFLGGVVITDHTLRRIYRPLPVGVTIVDPLYLDQGGVLSPEAPRLNLTVFTADASHAHWCVLMYKNGSLSLVERPPRPETVQLAETYFDADNPEVLAAADPGLGLDPNTPPVQPVILPLNGNPKAKADFDAAVKLYKIHVGD